jgi:hypothetical protein
MPGLTNHFQTAAVDDHPSVSCRRNGNFLNAQRSERTGRRPSRRRVKDAGALLTRLKSQVKADYNSNGPVNWRREAREGFDFEAGEQLNEEDKAILMDAKRPMVIFNRVGTTVDALAGQEVGNRQEKLRQHLAQFVDTHLAGLGITLGNTRDGEA